ncbi:hypothetical protein COLO4_14666 [Corchorus olitorius]|uniref:Uncharacterized protein n=1 Tax=Corchorus olitorius TaxID=93759 RepID=A0A1R3JR69_9ROSI|nr:hypothetical protein COLO4_14666 [Corchorus olitorius]
MQVEKSDVNLEEEEVADLEEDPDYRENGSRRKSQTAKRKNKLNVDSKQSKE